MEFVDIIDENEKIIATVSKKQMYADKLLHRIAHLFIFNSKGDLLLQKRSPTVFYRPGEWCTSAGGHVQAGETPEQAALRELNEELGIAANIEFIAKDFFMLEANKVEYSLELNLRKLLYTFLAKHEGPFVFPDGEVSETRWVPKEQVPQFFKIEQCHPELTFLWEKHFS